MQSQFSTIFADSTFSVIKEKQSNEIKIEQSNHSSQKHAGVTRKYVVGK